MEPHDLISLARRLVAGTLSLDEFVELAAVVARSPDRATAAARAGSGDPRTAAPSAVLPTATLDFDRRRRCGFPEVVFGEGKSASVLREIIAALVDGGEDVLATRISADVAAKLHDTFPAARYNSVARTFRVSTLQSARSLPAAAGNPKSEIGPPHVAVVTAGTSDLPVAEEARETLDWMGVRVTMIHDVGVAGPHRLPARLNEFEDADAIVVVAGMEGALPSIVGGYVACPVIGVPTSVGYGASFGGVSALLSMLNSCASNVAVVNIDAGFKGAYLAGLIAARRHARSNSDCGLPAAAGELLADRGFSDNPQSENRNPKSAHTGS